MISQDAFLDAVKNEYTIIRHLMGQVPATGWDYRPTPAQRSTLELARYLAHVGANIATFAATGSWERWDQIETPTRTMTQTQCATAIAGQSRAVTRALATLTPAKLKRGTIKDFTGRTVPLSSFLLGSLLGVLTAYRMQLFLYAKAAGNAALTTSDCWTGKAAKPAKATKQKKATAG